MWQTSKLTMARTHFPTTALVVGQQDDTYVYVNVSKRMKNYFLKTYLQTGSLHKTPPYPSLQTQVFGVFSQCPLTHPFMGMHSLQVLPTHPEKQLRRIKG